MIPAKCYSLDFFSTSCDRQVHTTLNCFVDGESRVLHTISPLITERNKASNFAYSEMEFPHVKKFYENVMNYTGTNEPPGYPEASRYSGANDTPDFSQFEISKIIYKGYLCNQAIGLKDGKVYFIHYVPGQEENAVVPFILTLEEFKAIPIDMIERHIDFTHRTALAWTKLGEAHGAKRAAQKVTTQEKNSVDNEDTGIKYDAGGDTGDTETSEKRKNNSATGYDECDCDCMYRQQTGAMENTDNTDKTNESIIGTSFREAIDALSVKNPQPGFNNFIVE